MDLNAQHIVDLQNVVLISNTTVQLVADKCTGT